ncbi:MAG: hypothetical protein ACKV19_16240 [Verrucomicrobiales bacterium]
MTIMNATEATPPAATPAPAPPPPPMSAEQLHADLNTIRSVLSEGAAERGPHRVIIAAANLACGAFMLLAVPIVLIVFSIPVFINPQEDGIVAVILIGLLAVGVLAAMAVPFLLAGWGLLKMKSWGPVAAVIAAILNVFNVPLGTALAGYTIWALVTGKLESDPVRSKPF